MSRPTGDHTSHQEGLYISDRVLRGDTGVNSCHRQAQSKCQYFLEVGLGPWRFVSFNSSLTIVVFTGLEIIVFSCTVESVRRP